MALNPIYLGPGLVSPDGLTNSSCPSRLCSYTCAPAASISGPSSGINGSSGYLPEVLEEHWRNPHDVLEESLQNFLKKPQWGLQEPLISSGISLKASLQFPGEYREFSKIQDSLEDF